MPGNFEKLPGKNERRILNSFEIVEVFMKPYIKTAKYYETDQMGIIHHSNYIRWMEEARVDVLNQLGFPYRKFEEMGYICPVLRAECEYKKSVKFDDEVKILMNVQELGRVKFTLGYRIYNMTEGGVLSASGSTTHCFLKKNGKPVLIDRELSDFCEVMTHSFGYDE